jgi:hypothetical protein
MYWRVINLVYFLFYWSGSCLRMNLLDELIHYEAVNLIFSSYLEVTFCCMYAMLVELHDTYIYWIAWVS